MSDKELEYRRMIESRLDALAKDVRYNTKLLEQLIELIPPRKPNTNMENLLKTQMVALRPLFERANFDGKEQILSMLDNLFGGRI